MSLYQQIKELRTKRKEALDAAGALLTKSHTDKREKPGVFTTEEQSEFDKRHAAGDELRTQIERLEKQMDAEASLAAVTDQRGAGLEDTDDKGNAPEMAPEKRKAMESKALRTWLGGGTGALDSEQRKMLDTRNVTLPQEMRQLSATSGSGGAYTIEPLFEKQLEIALKMYGGIIDVADYIPTETGAQLPWPSVNDTANSGEDIGETQAATETQDPSFGVVNFNAYMIDSGIVKIPVALTQDSAFNLEGQLTDELLPTRLGRRINSKCTSGNGNNCATGFLVEAKLGVTFASSSAITYNELLDLKHSVDPAYRNKVYGIGWMFNDATLKAVKKLVDGNGRPLFIAGGTAQGIQSSNPDTIDGDSFSINQDMPGIATGNKSVAYGAWKKYKVRKVRGTIMVRYAERYMNQFMIGIQVFQRYDGRLVDAGTNPLKYAVHP